MKLKVLSSEDMETVREWRSEVPETLRTPYELTYEMQQDYYQNVISNRESKTRYWGIWEQVNTERHAKCPRCGNPITWHSDAGGSFLRCPCCSHKFPMPGEQTLYNTFIGYGGIENIEWENGRGEISLLIGPDYRRKGYGAQAVEAILDKAFNYLRLPNVHGECYYISPAVPFWKNLVKQYGGYGIDFPGTKLYGGTIYASYLFNFYVEDWKKYES